MPVAVQVDQRPVILFRRRMEIHGRRHPIKPLEKHRAAIDLANPRRRGRRCALTRQPLDLLEAHLHLPDGRRHAPRVLHPYIEIIERLFTFAVGPPQFDGGHGELQRVRARRQPLRFPRHDVTCPCQGHLNGHRGLARCNDQPDLTALQVIRGHCPNMGHLGQRLTDRQRERVPDAHRHEARAPVPTVVITRLEEARFVRVAHLPELLRRRIEHDGEPVPGPVAQRGGQIETVPDQRAAKRGHFLVVHEYPAAVIQAIRVQHDRTRSGRRFHVAKKLPMPVLHPLARQRIEPDVPVRQDTVAPQVRLHGAGDAGGHGGNIKRQFVGQPPREGSPPA